MCDALNRVMYAVTVGRNLIPQDFRLNAQINVDWEAEMK